MPGSPPKTAEASPPATQAEPANTLDVDLAKYAHELYTKGDFEAGRKLLVELIGAVAVGGAVLTALTVWLPGIGLAVGSGTIAMIMMKVGEAYADLDAEDRKKVRAVVAWLKGGAKFTD